jgi:hypothetical protein
MSECSEVELCGSATSGPGDQDAVGRTSLLANVLFFFNTFFIRVSSHEDQLTNH